MAVAFGAVTPFCACSTVQMTLGLLEAGVPFGTVMSFVIASPLMDPLVFSLLVAFMGRLTEKKKPKKGSCCCNIELEEIPEEKNDNKGENKSQKDTGNS